MNEYESDIDPYDGYAEQFEQRHSDRQARRKRRPQARREPKRTAPELIEDVAEAIGLEGGFQTTYTPSLHEAAWLLESLREFYQQELISDVEALVKGGKEANVYRCTAHPATGEKWLAVKVYRPRKFRNLRNDHRYRLGRTALMPDGRPMKATDVRLQKAIEGKTRYGREVAHISWLMHEYSALGLLYEAGADVPKPYAASENAILMTYVGDGQMAAPALNEIDLETAEARRLFRRVIDNIALMLAYGRVHGDLSAYNILYWDGDVTLIDFPQMVYSKVSRESRHPINSTANPDAYDILDRDITRVCDYFGRMGVVADAEGILLDLWAQHDAGQQERLLADASRWQEAAG
jgi:RIO kinase 1